VLARIAEKDIIPPPRVLLIAFHALPALTIRIRRLRLAPHARLELLVQERHLRAHHALLEDMRRLQDSTIA
jgi:uncharacterized membrane protein